MGTQAVKGIHLLNEKIDLILNVSETDEGGAPEGPQPNSGPIPLLASHLTRVMRFILGSSDFRCYTA
jgi:hypothetical protein